MKARIVKDWNTYNLGEIALQGGYGLVDGPFGSSLPASDYTSSGIPVIRGTNLSFGEIRFRNEDFVFVSNETAQRLSRSLCKADDIIFTKKGTLGQIGIIPQNSVHNEYLISSNQMKLSVNKELANPLYVYYYLSSSSSREKIVRDADTTGVPKTNLLYLRKFPILLPPLPEQRAIARVLGSLDDKIELNRNMNATLEEIARTLFKSWFVDFDPVHAKAAGRAPAGMDAATAALFPDSFEEVQGRMVPRGWEVTNFASIVNILGGGTPKTDNPNYWNGDIPWFSVVDAPHDSDIFVIDTEKKITQQGLENSSTRLLSVGTSIISARGTVGKCALVGAPMAMNQSCYGVQPKHGFGSFFVFFLLRSTVNELLKKTHGAVFDTITRDTFKSVSVIVPNNSITMQFDMNLEPYFKRILLNIMQSRTIISVRDTLLPKLMSGEIRVRDAERFVEEQL